MTPPKMGDDLGQDDVTYDCNDPECRKRLAALEAKVKRYGAGKVEASLLQKIATLQAEVERLKGLIGDALAYLERGSRMRGIWYLTVALAAYEQESEDEKANC